MNRRQWLQWGALGGTALVVGGGLAAWLQPPVWHNDQLGTEAAGVMRAVGAAVLEGSLPTEPQAQRQALDALEQRLNGLIRGLPQHAHSELMQLLGLLATGAGRAGVAGLMADWPQATPQQVRDALQGMRTSRWLVRRQAYAALHDLSGGAWFSAPDTWAFLGYPGPVRIEAA
jgi:hypothetical protein